MKAWVFLNWLAIAGLLSVFLWKHHEVQSQLGPSASLQGFKSTVGLSESFFGSFGSLLFESEWYVERVRNGSAFWFPDLILTYGLLLSMIILLALLPKVKEGWALIYLYAIPNVLMALQMAGILALDSLLYLNAVPTNPQCGCLNSTQQFPSVYDCQCIVPFHDGTIRIITTNPENVTEAEFKQAGVLSDRIPPANLTIKYIAEEHNTEDLNTWNVDGITWEFALVQSIVVVALTRLWMFYLYHKDQRKVQGSNIFGSIISHFYFLMAETLDALSLFEEFYENWDYFVSKTDLVWVIFAFALVPLQTLMITSCPLMAEDGGGSFHRILEKAVIIFFGDLPLLGIRSYLLWLYTGEMRISIVFALFVVREIVMVVMGILELMYEIVSSRRTKKD